jgi:hypothetical protein
MQSPAGVPSITYCRIQQENQLGGGQGDLIQDGNSVIVLQPGQPSARYDVSHVIERNLSDEESCEVAFGHLSGGGLGAILNPVAAFVNDCVNVVVVVSGSRQTKKWSYLKRVLLPFLANEILANLDVKSREISPMMGSFRAQLAVSACEIQDEIISDLLRPANRNLTLTTTLEEGIVIQSLHREKILDEATLRKLLFDACDNRSVHALPVGGSIDTSSAIFEFRLHQSEIAFGNGNNPMSNQLGQGQGQQRESFSRFLVVDLPACDPLCTSQIMSGSQQPHAQPVLAPSLLTASSSSLYKSLFTFTEVLQQLGNVHRAQLAPFRGSKLTHVLSELLGGNALVMGLGLVVTGEASISRVCLDILQLLGNAMHFPLAAREQSDVLRGLLSKYRALLRHSQDNASEKDAHRDSILQETMQKDQDIQSLKRELAQKVLERDQLNELVSLLRSKHETLLQEKQEQSEKLIQSEEDNLALAQTLVQLQLALATQQEKYEGIVHDLDKDKLVLQGEKQNLHEKLMAKITEHEASEAEIRRLTEALQSKNTECTEFAVSLQDAIVKLQALEHKQVELSAEVLSQVNRADTLQAQYDRTLQEKDIFQQHNEQLEQEKVLWQVEEKKLLEKVVEKDEELLSLQRKLLQLRQEEATLAQEKELQSKQATQKSKELQVHKVLDTMHSLVDEKKEKLQAQKLQQAQTQCQRLSADLLAMQTMYGKVDNEMKHLLKRLRQTLADKLLLSSGSSADTNNVSYHNGNSSNNGDKAAGDVAASNSSNASDLIDRNLETALQELLRIHEQRERFLQQQLQRHSAAKDIAIRAYRQLFDQYRDFIEQLDGLTVQLVQVQKDWISACQQLSSASSSTSAAHPERSKGRGNHHKLVREHSLASQHKHKPPNSSGNNPEFGGLGNSESTSSLASDPASAAAATADAAAAMALAQLSESLTRAQQLLSEQFHFLASNTPPNLHQLPVYSASRQSTTYTPRLINNNRNAESEVGTVVPEAAEIENNEEEEEEAVEESEQTQVMRQTGILLTAYQRKLQESERRTAVFQQQNINLQEQVRVLLARLQQQQISQTQPGGHSSSTSETASGSGASETLQSPNHPLSSSPTTSAAVTANHARENEQYLEQHKELIESLVSEVRHLRRQLLDSQQKQKQSSLHSQSLENKTESKEERNVEDIGGAHVSQNESHSNSREQLVQEDLLLHSAFALLSTPHSGEGIGGGEERDTVGNGASSPPPQSASSSRSRSSRVSLLSARGKSIEVAATTNHNVLTAETLRASSPPAGASSVAAPLLPHPPLSDPLPEATSINPPISTAATTSVSMQRLQVALQAAETRNSVLSTRATQLEEELSSYQQYMKNVLPQYQRKLLLLQQQQQQQQQQQMQVPQGKSIAAVGSSDVKFPPIK